MSTGNPYSVHSVVANTAVISKGVLGNAPPHKKHDEPISWDNQFRDWILPPVIDSTLSRQPILKTYYDASNPRVLGDGSDKLQVHVKLIRGGHYVLCPIFWKFDDDINKFELYSAEMQPLDTSRRKFIEWSYDDWWGTNFE